jgi:hypothetical protein
MSLPSSYRSRQGHIHLPRVLPMVGCRSETPTASALVTGRHRRSHGELDGFNLHQANYRSTTNTPTSILDPPPTRTRRPHGPSHASRPLSHRAKTSLSTGTSHMASAMLAGPTRNLSQHARLARKSTPTTLWTLTPPLATTRTPLTSSTSGRNLSSPNSRSSRLSNRGQDQPPVWL